MKRSAAFATAFRRVRSFKSTPRSLRASSGFSTLGCRLPARSWICIAASERLRCTLPSAAGVSLESRRTRRRSRKPSLTLVSTSLNLASISSPGASSERSARRRCERLCTKHASYSWIRHARAATRLRSQRSRRLAYPRSGTFRATPRPWRGIRSSWWPKAIASISCSHSICFRKPATSRRWFAWSTLILLTDPIDIRYVAKLARLALTEEEIERFGKQLGELLEHVNALKDLDIASVPATAQVVESRNVTREDSLRPCLDRETVLAQAPQRQGPFFRVPRI